MALDQFEFRVQLTATVITNLCMVPGCVQLIRYKRVYEFFCASLAAFTSFMYHYCDTLGDGATVFGMTELQWHRLDNIFALATLTNLWVMLQQHKHLLVEHIQQCAMLCFIIITQEAAPWNELFSVLPIALAIATTVVYFGITKTKLVINRRDFATAISCMAIGFVFFTRGLDERADWCRLQHGLWHAFIGGTGYFWVRSLEEFELQRLDIVYTHTYNRFSKHTKQWV